MFKENYKLAMASIKSARFRSLLTMFGIIIAVVSVITTMSLGEGIKRQISGQAGAVGSDAITIRPGKLVKRDTEGQVKGVNLLSFLAANKLNEKDLQTIRQNKHVEKAVPFSFITATPSLGDKRFNEGFVMATSSGMPELTGQKVEFGNFFGEVIGGRKVAVIGFGVAEKLFQENVPIGKTMQINGHNFVVMGVLERRTATPLNPEAVFNDGIFIPHETGKAITGNDLLMYQIVARSKDKSPSGVEQTISSLHKDLKAQHRGQEDFTILRQEEMVAVANNVLGLVTKTIAIMAAITFFVGGVGIMNAMMVSVTERTREIGIRKAVGATNRQIHNQFLFESIVLSIRGAIIGTFLSFLINFLLIISTNLQPVITWQSVLLSSLAAIMVGVAFGIVPAVKASRKDPIEALRSY